MFVTLFILLVVASYVVTGVFVARSQYTLAMRQYGKALIEHTPDARTDKHILIHMPNYLHKSYCYTQYNSLRNQGCNCESGEAYLSRERKRLAPPAKPSPPISNVISWPVVVTSNFITSGAKNLPDYEAIARYEREVKELQ